MLQASAFFRKPLKSDSLDDFNAAAREFLDEKDIKLLYEMYKLGSGAVSNIEIETGFTQFTSDARFYFPVVLTGMAALESADLRIYHFLEVSGSHYIESAFCIMNN